MSHAFASPADDPANTAPAVLTRSHVELHDELHARPPLPVPLPGVVSYWTQWRLDGARAEAALAVLCRASGDAVPSAGVRHHVVHGQGFDLKFERHGEFVSWQVVRPLSATEVAALPADATRLSAITTLPQAFMQVLADHPMQGAVHVLLVPDDLASADPDRWFSAASKPDAEAPETAPRLLGGLVAGGGATVMTDLQLHDDGFVRFVQIDHGDGGRRGDHGDRLEPSDPRLTPAQRARTVQRLCELEAYRMLAMLGFPLAQQESAALAGIESRLQATVDAMSNDDAHDDATAFDTLTTLAAEVEHGAARTRYRFSATRAYQRLVEQRLTDLREVRLPGLQTLTGFFARRFAPAMALCAATDARLTDIADRINRAVSLARVRVEMQREAGNQALFKALAHRQKLQLRLQQAVEGLSVVAISYYALGLVGYIAKAFKDSLPVSPDVAVGLAVLPVLIGVTVFIRRLRKHYEEHD